MREYNYSEARNNLASVLEEAINGEPVTVTRRGQQNAVIISQAEFERLKEARYDADFEAIWSTHGDSIRVLTDR